MTKTKKLLKGGKYLGEGSYGCVISPAIPCIDKYSTVKLKNKIIIKKKKRQRTILQSINQ